MKQQHKKVARQTIRQCLKVGFFQFQIPTGSKGILPILITEDNLKMSPDQFSSSCLEYLWTKYAVINNVLYE